MSLPERQKRQEPMRFARSDFRDCPLADADFERSEEADFQRIRRSLFGGRATIITLISHACHRSNANSPASHAYPPPESRARHAAFCMLVAGRRRMASGPRLEKGASTMENRLEVLERRLVSAERRFRIMSGLALAAVVFAITLTSRPSATAQQAGGLPALERRVGAM